LTEDFGSGREQTFNATGNYANIQVPVVVLVNENSASASELVAGALQDTGTATIIGEDTFGKGVVQTWQGLVNGGGIRLTVARWLTPNRRWIQGEGVTPDIVVASPTDSTNSTDDPQLATAIDFLQSLVTQPVTAQ